MLARLLSRNLSCIRQLPTTTSNVFITNRNTSSSNNYIPVYKLPYIRVASLVNRLKLYQTSVTAVTLPASLILYGVNVISYDAFLLFWSIGLTGTLSLFLLGTVPNRMVGFIYVSENNKTVKLSHLNSWGTRLDVEIPLDDIVPLTDLPAVPTDPLYMTLRRFSNRDTYKLNLKYGVVLDKRKFNQVFLQEIK